MKLRRVAVVGGGPGGLYVARLLKRAQPGCEVDVYEQGDPDSTFGFGVGLAAGTQRNLRRADPDSLVDILDHGHAHDMSLRVGSQVARMPDDNLRAIARTTLLEILQRHAREAGVRLHFGVRVAADELDVDLVIAADGVGSVTRDSADFGVQVDVGEALYLWCGTEFALPSALFMPVTTDSGTFVTHAYPYAPGLSTFLVETDEQTWRAAGFDVTTDDLAGAPAGQSDDQSLRYLEAAFAEPLQGHSLIGNRTRWLRFRSVRCARWHVDNVVLLGDAAHTAHYSIGSGTKLAMEDAIALVAAIDEHDDLDTSLTAYEAVRRPAVEHLQDVAARSQRWWDSFPDRLHLPVNQLLVSYMTRAGKVPLARFAESTPAVVAAALVEYSGTAAPDTVLTDETALTDFVLTPPDGRDRTMSPAQPVADVVFAEDDPWGPKADAALAVADDAVTWGAASLRVDGPPTRDDVLNRLDLAERLRRRCGVPVSVTAPRELLADLLAGLVAGRTDLVDVR